MNIAVVPAKNEEGRIGKVLTTLGDTPLDRIVVVVNGSHDHTLSEVLALNMPKVKVLYFEMSLGIDVPRALGAYVAYKEGATAVVFVDGDMIGKIQGVVMQLVDAVIFQKADLALTDCYPQFPYGNKFANQMLCYRKLLNQKLGLYPEFKVATPSHGPHAVSRRLMEKADFRDFAVPPMILALAVKHHLNIAMPAALNQVHFGSRVRDYYHAKKIVDTVIGDTIEALNFFDDRPRTRRYLFKDFQGYHPERRFDILDKFMKDPHLLEEITLG